MPCSAASAGSSEPPPARRRRPGPWGRPWLSAAAGSAFLLAGCALLPRPEEDPLRQKGRLRRWPAATRDHPCEFVTPTCRVRTNTNADVAEYVATVLDIEREAFGRLFGTTPTRRISVHVLRSRKEMRAARPDVAVTRTTVGLSDLASAEILVAYEKVAGRHPSSIILHEGAHQYLADCFDFSVPERWRPALATARLQSVPWWLHEGFAAYMECAKISASGLHTGGVNQGRWGELRTLIRKQRCPPLRNVLAAMPLDLNRSPYYAVAWGLVHVLLETTGEEQAAAERRARLGRYLQRCRDGWDTDGVTELARHTAADAGWAEGFRRQWHRRVAEQAAAEFERCFIPPGETIEQWETRWRQTILRLKH